MIDTRDAQSAASNLPVARGATPLLHLAAQPRPFRERVGKTCRNSQA
ncbi:hypothetical protein [Lysobacter gummosus]